jgi:hypothetical protein
MQCSCIRIKCRSKKVRCKYATKIDDTIAVVKSNISNEEYGLLDCNAIQCVATQKTTLITTIMRT